MIHFKRILDLNWYIISIICIVSCISFLMLYSAADANLNPWALRQFMRFILGFCIMIVVACIDIRRWFAWSYHLYFFAFSLVLGVELLGIVGMGAQRWLDLYIITIQPSELMKVCLMLALAKYFHNTPFEDVKFSLRLIAPVLMILLPTFLVLRQPDLGTALLLLLGGASILFVAGVSIWAFVTTGLSAIALLPILWNFLYDYQKKRVLIFLNPESDPTNAGYHIMQSKIALGSGGLFGKGYLLGTQSHLNFLPEKQTDFIFTMFCEEFGFIGAIVLITLYCILILQNLNIALYARNSFGRYLALGFTFSLFLYVFVNIGMVMGVLPVVGIPLPFMSYGGTAIITLLFSQGLIFSVALYNETRLRH